MKQLANYIRIMPLSDYQSFDGNTMSGYSTPDLILSENDLDLQDEPATSNAGVLYTQKLEIVTERLSDTLRKKYANKRAVMVLLYDDQEISHLWGDENQKLYILITPGIYNDSITLTRKAISTVL